MRNKAKFVLRICGWLVIAFVTLEVCARTEDKVRYGASFFGNYGFDSLYTYDAMGKYGLPHASYLKWHLNELGYRGPAIRSGTYRIACVGSSETFGLYESPEMEWPRQLESSLNEGKPDRPYEVINVAYPGMSMATSLKRLPRVLSEVQPKLVVIYPSYTPYISINHPLVQQSEAAPVGAKPASDNDLSTKFELRLKGRFDTLMKASIPQGMQHWLRDKEARNDSRGITVMDRLPDQNIQAFESDLDNLTQQLLSHGVKVVLVTHANRFGSKLDPVDAPYLTDWRKFFPTLQEQGFLDMESRMSDAVRQVASRRSVSLVDAAALIPSGHKNFQEFVHFTDAGSKVLASAVADDIEHDVTEGSGKQGVRQSNGPANIK